VLAANLDDSETTAEPGPIAGSQSRGSIVSVYPDRQGWVVSTARDCESTPEWVSNFGQQFEATMNYVDAACTAPEALPKTVPKEIQRQFVMDQAYEYFVATIPDGRVIADSFMVTPAAAPNTDFLQSLDARADIKVDLDVLRQTLPLAGI
jgi:hypothetical protein